MQVSTRIQLKTPTGILPVAKTIIERHGCLVEDGSVTLPIGSRRTGELNIRAMSVWYRLELPDCYEMVEADDHWNKTSVFYLPLE